MNYLKWAEPEWDQLTLWKTVDKPGDNPTGRARDSTFLPKDKSLGGSLFLATLVDALANAVDVLAARVEHVEHQLDQLLAYSDAPLTPDALVARLRELRDELRGG